MNRASDSQMNTKPCPPYIRPRMERGLPAEES